MAGVVGTDCEGQGDLLCHKTSLLTIHPVLLLGQGRAAGPSHCLERRSRSSGATARPVRDGPDMSVGLADTEGKPGPEEKGTLNP